MSIFDNGSHSKIVAMEDFGLHSTNSSGTNSNSSLLPLNILNTRSCDKFGQNCLAQQIYSPCWLRPTTPSLCFGNRVEAYGT